MTTIRQILDIKLANNDLNIIDDIMTFKHQMEKADHKIKFNPVIDEINDIWVHTENNYFTGLYTFNNYMNSHYFEVNHNTNNGLVYGGLMIKQKIDDVRFLD